MKTRCLNPRATQYPHYGGRGIKICERWLSFENFLADMGERPPGMCIDRIDNDGNYEPGNCRWTTMRVQVDNRRTSKLRPHHRLQIAWLRSIGMPRADIAERFGVSASYVKAVAKRYSNSLPAVP